MAVRPIVRFVDAQPRNPWGKVFEREEPVPGPLAVRRREDAPQLLWAENLGKWGRTARASMGS